MSDIIGTAAAERLLGTAGSDTIEGNGGGDRIDGGRGDDVLTGGDDGTDTLFGEAGNDQLNGGGGADNLYGGMGDDVVHGGDGNDYIVRDEARGSDILYGEAGDDYIVVGSFKGSGASQAYGGDGNDYFTIDVRTGATVAIDGGAGDDWVDLISWDSAATVTLGAGRDLITLETAFTFTGTSSTGVTVTDFTTGPGGDVLQIAEALIDATSAWDGVSNPFTAGFLRLTQSGADTILDVSAQANGTFTRAFVFKNVDASSFTAENFAGLPLTGTTSAPLTLTGSDLGDVLSGGAGDDVIDGGAGRDRIYGGFGADTLSGGDDADRILGGAGNDVIDGGAGNDSLYGGFGDDIVHGGADNDFLSDNETGIDQLYGDDGNDQLWVQRDSWRSGGNVSLYGGAGDDLLAINTTNADPVTADGGAGTDRLHIYNLVGSVTAALGDGSDVIELGTWSKSTTSSAAITVTDFAAGDGGDRLDWYSFLVRNATGYVADSNPFTTGYARLVQSGANVLLQFDRDGPAATNGFVTLITFGNTSLSAFAAFNLGGFAPDGSTPVAQAFTGTPDSDHFYSAGGADTVDGAGGNDALYGAAGAQTIGGGDGNDLIHGGPGADVIDGGADNDTIYGEQGSDSLTGGAGDDYLNDTQGAADSLSGGDGNDQIYIERSAASDSATVSGGDGDDLIQVSVSAGSATIDAGAGNDLLSFYASASTILTLGSGADTLSFYSYGTTPGSITITDFQAGDGGDRIDWDEWLLTRFTNFQPAVGSDRNPFSSGYAKLVQSGADAILQVDMSGSGTAYVNWITFKNTSVWSLTAYNFDGYETNFSLIHGTTADETFQGGTGNDGFDGGGGNDSFLIGYGGSDYAAGGSGDDSFLRRSDLGRGEPHRHRRRRQRSAPAPGSRRPGDHARHVGGERQRHFRLGHRDGPAPRQQRLEPQLGAGRRGGLHSDPSGFGHARGLDPDHRRRRPGQRRHAHFLDHRERCQPSTSPAAPATTASSAGRSATS
jgi:Ca2+-binding RTX toxin-like protein